jgi:hypothetical protein
VSDAVDLAALRSWANRTNPEHPEWRQHLYDAQCPWCRDTVHETAMAVLDEIVLVRRALLDLVLATSLLRAGDGSSDALFKVLDTRHRACVALGIDSTEATVELT